MDKLQIDALITRLENVQRRPLMWMGNQLPEVVNFLWGFRAALMALNLDIDSFRQAVESERGWYNSCQHPYLKMQEHGLTTEQITHELISIEIEALQRFLSKPTNAL